MFKINVHINHENLSFIVKRDFTTKIENYPLNLNKLVQLHIICGMARLNSDKHKIAINGYLQEKYKANIINILSLGKKG